ncbi:MAG: YncE family protein [Phycisphaerales bacterium JB037]
MSLDRRACVSASLTLCLLAGSAVASPPVSMIHGFDDPDGATPVVELVVPGTAKVTLGEAASLIASRDCLPAFSANAAPEGDMPTAVKFLPDGSAFIIAHRDTNNLLVFDSATRALIRDIPLSGSPADLAITADGTTAITANMIQDTISFVDLSTGTEVAVVGAGDGPGQVRITPDQTTALVGNIADGTITVLDIAARSPINLVTGVGFFNTFSANFEAFAVTSTISNPFEIIDNTRLLFADRGNDRIQVIDFVTNAVTNLPSAADPARVSINADGSTAVVSHVGSDDVITVVDLAVPSISKTIAIPSGGPAFNGAIAINPTGTKAAVAISNASVIVDLATNAVSPSLSTASVNEFVNTFDGSRVLAVGFFGSLLDYATGTKITDTNNQVSGALGGASPIADLAVMCSTTFGDDKVVVSTAAVGAGLIEFTRSGSDPEGDRMRSGTVSPDGAIGLATGNFSDTVVVYDTVAGTVLGYAPVGQRPGEVRVTPDSSKAVVANRDSTFATVIDLNTFTSTDVNISTRGDQVEISPDGRYAYIFVISGGDGVWRIDLDTNAVAGPKLITGDGGGVSFAGNQFSGMAQSPDGSVLVTCNTYANTGTNAPDSITLIDAVSWSVFTTVTVGDFPVRAAFAPDGGEVYVSNRNEDTVSIVDLTLAVPIEVASPFVGDSPYEMVASPDGTRLYVSLAGSNPGVAVVDLNTRTLQATIPLTSTPTGIALSDDGSQLFVSGGSATASNAGGLTFTDAGEIAVIDTTSNTVSEIVCTDSWMTDLAIAANGRGFAPNLAGEAGTPFAFAAACPADLTGSADPNDLSYGNPDGDADGDDFFFYLDAFTNTQLATCDLTGSSDPNDPSYAIPDGDCDGDDFFFYLDLFVAGCS